MRYPSPPESLVVSRRRSKSGDRKRIVDTIGEHVPRAGLGLELPLRSFDGGSIR
jgi:hypothetical protein